MKRRVLILYIIIPLLLLSGCDGNLFSSRRDMERLRPIQAIGFDRDGPSVTVSISSGIGPDNSPPLVMKAAASGIETAIARLQDYSPEDELTYAHVQYILLGDSVTEECLLQILDWAERSPAMRMEIPVLLVKGSAADAVISATGESADITKRLSSLEREEASRGQHIFTLREVASSLIEHGCALCLCVESLSSDGTIYTEPEPGDAVVPSGYAVLRPGAEPVFLTQDETLGAELMIGRVNGSRITVDGNVLEVINGRADISGRRENNGALTGILIRCELQAGVLEREPDAETDPDILAQDLSAAAWSWLEDAVSRSQELSCDYLDLVSAVSAPTDPSPYDPAYVLSLPVTIIADCNISRSYDLAD